MSKITIPAKEIRVCDACQRREDECPTLKFERETSLWFNAMTNQGLQAKLDGSYYTELFANSKPEYIRTIGLKDICDDCSGKIADIITHFNLKDTV